VLIEGPVRAIGGGTAAGENTSSGFFLPRFQMLREEKNKSAMIRQYGIQILQRTSSLLRSVLACYISVVRSAFGENEVYDSSTGLVIIQSS
jgi:hypothetical protein